MRIAGVSSRAARQAGIGPAGAWMLRGFSWTVLALLTFPLIVLVGASFSASDYVHFPPFGFSLKWYGAFVKDPTFLNSLILSGEIAGSAACFATLLGFPAAYILSRKRFRGRGFLESLFLSPLLVPQIIVGVALLQFFTFVGIATSFAGLLVAHVVSVMPYVIRTVTAALQNLDPRIEEAAADLGANRLEVMALVVAPVVKGGLIAGALFAFIMSWVNVEVSIFLGVTGGYTLPVVLYNFMEYSITTVVVAAASVAIYVGIALVLLIDRVIGINTASRL